MKTSLKLKKSEIHSLIQSGKRPHWRLKLDDETIEWSDMIHGKIVFSNLSSRTSPLCEIIKMFVSPKPFSIFNSSSVA